MTAEELIHIANKWMEFFNEKNLESLLSMYDDMAQHYSPKLKIRHPETQGFIKGKEALRKWWADSFERLPTLQYKLVRLTPYHDRIFMEYTRHVENEGDLHVGEMLEVVDGRIFASTVFHR